ncbi:hypothetical protein [Nonomuraea basaltis]|uniref:hypothetical protein n=1 Tax=Nonomuraea basaltis TaxID=2495887 RepID=UPI00110C3F8B|nr:hypothetical protein [Nonomuraea basaltis]TMR90605.1 hypothetical protein EJK15_54435 [Nonomuraea basaltis]
MLRLPLMGLGRVSEEPFALIVDQAPPEGDGRSMPSLAVWAEQIGARGVWVTPETVEIVEPDLPEIVDHVPFDTPAEPVNGGM